MPNAKIETSTPVIKGTICRNEGRIKGTIKAPSSILGMIKSSPLIIKGKVTKDKETESYYEVSNDYGTTIIIGD